jgi:glc operon protein GlcG
MKWTLLDTRKSFKLRHQQNQTENTMNHKELTQLVEKLFSAIEKRIPDYLSDPIDMNIAKGNVAVCIIDRDGNLYGKLFGTDKILQRNFFKVAWIKASQVWITGLKTGEFETLVYAKKIDERKFGISKPDFIGWDGGQPITVDNETVLSVGFSGFQGVHDLEIVVKAFEDIRQK